MKILKSLVVLGCILSACLLLSPAFAADSTDSTGLQPVPVPQTKLCCKTLPSQDLFKTKKIQKGDVWHQCPAGYLVKHIRVGRGPLDPLEHVDQLLCAKLVTTCATVLATTPCDP